MARSTRLRPDDWRGVFQLAGECREVGDDPAVWRDHWLRTVVGLVDADLGHFGEQVVQSDYTARDRGVVVWGHQQGFVSLDRIQSQLALLHGQPNLFLPFQRYFQFQCHHDGV